MKENIIRAILYQDMSVKWKSGSEMKDGVNIHLNVHQKTRQFVEAELGDFILSDGEAILASFEKSTDGNIYHVNPTAMEKVEDSEEGRPVFRLQIPTDVHNTPGEWGVQFSVVTGYDSITGDYTECYPFVIAKFSEYSSFIDDGLTVPSKENLKALYDSAQKAVEEAVNVAEAALNSRIVQEAGSATDKVMSQNAVTKELDKKANVSDMTLQLNAKADKTYVDDSIPVLTQEKVNSLF